MKILGIETSCDDTCVAIYDESKGIIANEICKQDKIHNLYGGIVPELASRNHMKNIIPLIKKTFKISKTLYHEISGIAYTAGPGLIGSLLIGATLSKSLGFSWNVPTKKINHMEGHLLTPMLENKKILFPFTALLVSGKHTQIINAISLGNYKIIGNSLDDAAGEVFDKISNILGLGYPGGKKISKLAKKNNSKNIKFPRPMTKNNKDLNFSFSGLKTFVINEISKININNYQIKANIAYAFENAIVDTLIIKIKRALKLTKHKNLIISGGVSANHKLRSKMSKIFKKKNINIFYPSKNLCTDNGAMIAYAGMLHFKNSLTSNFDLEINVYPKWLISDIKY
ncbi:tRNA N6-adenosine threonylcarbamoyltransferase [Candidatus Annandia adelgestsuga]|uniref:tRNA N6-adenosine threonylcarbamoyltransferase n=1 Tax=Candidatus Annandia adelgestsuga TaxID=1302411 RepID=A0A3S9J7B1_9ENTR|nr:tRNA (adenosine(37)-N6)-threonylcarbamoyltransferase complex transferase subunit TsaD [Candidatus Annandia adelgestsuga]AZP36261.1 tRNA N6-adenosine threonylcarbamoyltransferase [Candidatus Annandia adelgestsuga]